MSLSIREASRSAVGAVTELFDEQSISNVMFEEVDKDAAGNWLITVGFDRKLEKSSVGLGGMLGEAFRTERKYKVVKVDDSGEVLSVKDRLLATK